MPSLFLIRERDRERASERERERERERDREIEKERDRKRERQKDRKRERERETEIEEERDREIEKEKQLFHRSCAARRAKERIGYTARERTFSLFPCFLARGKKSPSERKWIFIPPPFFSPPFRGRRKWRAPVNYRMLINVET